MTIFLELFIIGVGGLIGAGIGRALGEPVDNLLERSRIFNSANTIPGEITIRRRRGERSGSRRPKLDPEREHLLMHFVSDDIKRLTNNDIELEDECPICLEPFNITEIIKELPCSHFFHIECIEDWEKRQNNCPYCRKEF